MKQCFFVFSILGIVFVTGCSQSDQVESGEKTETDKEKTISNGVSDEEFEQFVEFMQEMQTFYAQTENILKNILEEEGMSAEEYGTLKRTELPPAEMLSPKHRKLKHIDERLADSLSLMENAVIELQENIGLDSLRFREISLQVQTDPEFRNKLMDRLGAE